MVRLKSSAMRVLQWPAFVLAVPWVKWGAILFGVGLGAALPQLLGNDYYVHIVTMILFYAYMASCWNIVGGYGGQISLGHAAFAGIGGYTSTLLFIQLNVSPWLGMFVGALLAATAAVVVGYPCFRLRGPYFVLSTLAFAEILRIWVDNTQEIFGIKLMGSRGLLLPLRENDPWAFQFGRMEYYYYVALIMVVLIVLLVHALEKNRLGVYLTAIRSDQDAAEALGINAARVKLRAFAISAALTAMGGTFYVQFIHYINPARMMGIDFSIELALMTVVGGAGTLLGPILGSGLLNLAAEITRTTVGGANAGVDLILYGLVLILAVLFMPRGIVGLARRLLPSARPAALGGSVTGSTAAGVVGAGPHDALKG